MSTKHIRSTADLVRFGASLKIECGHCGAARTRTGPEIALTCGTVSLDAVAGQAGSLVRAVSEASLHLDASEAGILGSGPLNFSIIEINAGGRSHPAIATIAA